MGEGVSAHKSTAECHAVVWFDGSNVSCKCHKIRTVALQSENELPLMVTVEESKLAAPPCVRIDGPYEMEGTCTHQKAGMRALGRPVNEGGGGSNMDWGDSVRSGTEKRLLEDKVLDWRLRTCKQQLCSTTYAHAKGRKESGWLQQRYEKRP